MCRLSIRRVNAQQWPHIASRFLDLTYEQALSYGESAAARLNAVPQFVTVEHDGCIVAAACARIKTLPILNRGIAYIAAGPLVCRDDVLRPNQALIQDILAALKRHYVDNENLILRLRPAAIPPVDWKLFDSPAYAAGFEPTDRAASYRTVLVNAACDERTLLTRMKKDWCRRLKAALRMELELERGRCSTLWERFEKIYEELRVRKDFSDDLHPRFYMALKDANLDCQVLLAKHDGQDVAGQIVATSRRTANSLFAATTLRGRELGASNFLDWKCIEFLKDRSIHWLDLGGIDEVNNPDGAQYKLRTGGTVVSAAGPYVAYGAGITVSAIATLEQAHKLTKRWRRFGVGGILNGGATASCGRRDSSR